MSSYTESPRNMPRVRVHPLAWIGAVMSRVAHAVMTEMDRRKAIGELRTFDDHMLADIGLRRSDIESAVHFGRRSSPIRMPGS